MRTKVQLTYNPFLTEKKANLTINGQEQSKDYLNDNLQSWINQLFLGLKDEWEGCTAFDFEFTGLEVDRQDVREAVEQAKEQGFDIRFTENVVARSSSERLAELEALFAEMKEDPMFKDKISKHNDFKALEENIFDVFVVATMSSGKSTFINAMLGCDLLPAQNEATTAAIAEIFHNPNLSQGVFKAARKNSDGEYLDQNVTLDVSNAETADSARALLSKWNKEIDDKSIELNKRTATIHLEGHLVGINIPTNLKLRLSDTPGPNNSNELNHAEITLRKIKDTQGNNPLIIYLLDGSKLAITDDNQLLVNIANEMNGKGKLASDRFIFLLNRMDEYFNKAEKISKTIENAKDYLRKHNITDPKVYPITAKLARLNRINNLNDELLGEDELDVLEILERGIKRQSERDLTQYMALNSKQKTYLSSIEDSAIKRSGVPAVEKVISDYIEKYNEPYRIMQMTKVIDEVLKETRAEVEMDIQLDKKEEELEELRNKLKIAEEKLGKSQEFEKKINELKEKEILLSEDVSILFKQSSTKIENLITQYSRRLDGEVRLAFAKKELQKLGELLNNELYDLDANIEKVNNQTQQKQLAELNAEYSDFVSNYFDDLFDGIQVDLIKNFKQKSISLQNYLNLEKNNIFSKSVVIGRRKIERGFFEKLFSLDFSEHFEDITERIEFARDISNTLKKLNSEVLLYLQTLSVQLIKNAESLTQLYCEQLNLQFKTATAKFNNDLAEKTKRDDLEQIIKEANSKLTRLAKNEAILNRNKLLSEV
ncbi:dynamin family protein [Actinobacillus porcinus]|uniref:dynamin family protein n=1 Tax=Actinobacillus porcinus TaxID=51048 RepID=UPI0023551481|nr:dynamin family protein [Actinobacillus porcinus]